MNILGISAFYHDSAACLVRDGEIIAAVQEERFTRKRHDAGFPKHAVRYCLEEAGIKTSDLDYVGFYDKPFIKFERILETYLSIAPSGMKQFLAAIPIWLKDKLWTRENNAHRRGLGGRYFPPLLFPGISMQWPPADNIFIGHANGFRLEDGPPPYYYSGNLYRRNGCPAESPKFEVEDQIRRL